MAAKTGRELLRFVLAWHLEQPQLLSTADHVKIYCVKQQEFVPMETGYKKEIANATTFIDCKTIFVIESFSNPIFQLQSCVATDSEWTCVFFKGAGEPIKNDDGRTIELRVAKNVLTLKPMQLMPQFPLQLPLQLHRPSPRVTSAQGVYFLLLVLLLLLVLPHLTIISRNRSI